MEMSNPEEGFDERVREWLEPDQQSVERVKARVLSATSAHPNISWILASLALVSLLIAGGGIWLRHAATLRPNELTATFEGDVLVVRAPDGTCWISGPPSAAPNPPGTWQITYQGER
jgi:hypothetical protein